MIVNVRTITCMYVFIDELTGYVFNNDCECMIICVYVFNHICGCISVTFRESVLFNVFDREY